MREGIRELARARESGRKRDHRDVIEGLEREEKCDEDVVKIRKNERVS